MCVPFIINQTPASRRNMSRPQPTALTGLWAIPSTESGPQQLLVTYNQSSLASVFRNKNFCELRVDYTLSIPGLCMVRNCENVSVSKVGWKFRVCGKESWKIFAGWVD